jgi:hypothetical protein
MFRKQKAEDSSTMNEKQLKQLDALSGAVVDTIKRTVTGPLVKDRFEALERRIAQLEARPTLKDGGIWKHGATYALGDVAQFSGSAWVCTKAHLASGPTADHTCWRLWIKRGRDGKDTR